MSFVLFAAFILFMVVRAFQEDFDLVAEDYYAQEINYQNKLRQKANLYKLNDKVSIFRENGHLILSFPKNTTCSGEIHFYHISRKIFDKKFTIDLDVGNRQIIKLSELAAGQYSANITWGDGNKEYFQQERIFIQ